MLAGKGRDAPYTHGDGYGHVAFGVDDLRRERDRAFASRLLGSRDPAAVLWGQSTVNPFVVRIGGTTPCGASEYEQA